MFHNFVNVTIVTILNIVNGLDGNETAGIQKHKLRFRLGKYRLYKVWSTNTNKEFYIITENLKMPKYKYKAYRITGGLKRLNNNLFYWRNK